MLTVIIPCNNEEGCIAACLGAFMRQTGLSSDHRIQLIVAANGCNDATVAIARGQCDALRAAGYDPVVMDIATGNKVNALNESDAIAQYDARVYVDADVLIGPTLLAELGAVLASDRAVYASGTVKITPPKSLMTKAYAKVWIKLPFVADGVPGIGVYAVNAKGRARWGKFPDIYADDLFVRWQFTPDERQKVSATYLWPLAEGFANLVHVRHRWNKGQMQLAARYPELVINDGAPNSSVRNALRLLRTPFASAIFVAVTVMSKRRARRSGVEDSFVWQRGR